MNFRLALVLLFFLQPGDAPLEPAWSPDHQILATTKVLDRFITPEGANYTLLLNGRAVYPKPRKSRWFSAYSNQHTFLTELAWSPDSQNVAFFEKVYDWQYSDPYNSDFQGEVSNMRYYLVIVSRTGTGAGYQIDRAPPDPRVDWLGNSKIALNGRRFDLHADPPRPIK